MYVRDEIKRKKEAANSVPDGVVVVTQNESKSDAGIPNFTKTSTLTAITVRTQSPIRLLYAHMCMQLPELSGDQNVIICSLKLCAMCSKV